MADAAAIIGTTWQLERLLDDGEEVSLTEKPPTLRLAAERAGGFGGVNRWFAAYETAGGELRFGALGSTLMAGPEPSMAVEQAFFRVLGRVDGWAVAEETLELRAGGDPVAWFRALAESVDGAWHLTAMNNGAQAVVTVPPDISITATFREGTVAGSAGCNRYRAPYEIEEDRLGVGPAAVTRMLCPAEVMEIESRFLECLEAAARFEVIDGDQLHCYDEAGSRLLQFRREVNPPSESDAPGAG